MRLEAHEIAFIDGAIADRERLLADFMRATGPDRAIEIVVLDPARDGIAQIGEALAARKGLTAVHVLSHGRDGAIDLGATTLDAAALAGRADAIAAWAGAFAADGDLLLFGCDVADTVRGEGFLGELARLTGADVAASDDPTGDAARGGDWDLEFATGAIEAAVAPLADAAWGGLLATEVLDWDDPAIDWPDGYRRRERLPVGGANVTVTVTDPAGRLNNGSPDDDALVDLGGLGAIEQGLYVSSTGFNASESSTITIDFAHPGGVSNVSFTIFDIDRGGGPNFIDEIQASFTASGAVTLAITNGPNNTVDRRRHGPGRRHDAEQRRELRRRQRDLHVHRQRDHADLAQLPQRRRGDRPVGHAARHQLRPDADGERPHGHAPTRTRRTPSPRATSASPTSAATRCRRCASRSSRRRAPCA